MTLYKNVDGERIKMSTEEEAEIRAEWAENENPTVGTDTINAEIDQLLADTDWTQVVDADLTNAEKSQWNGYRAALRAVDRTPRQRDLGLLVPPGDTKRNGR